MSASVLNTFSKQEAERIHAEGRYKIIGTRSVELLPVNSILQDFMKVTPDFVSLDVEGLDLDVLRTLDLDKYRPSVFCVENLEFSVNQRGKKLGKISKFFELNDYFEFADTHINTVFVDKRIW